MSQKKKSVDTFDADENAVKIVLLGDIDVGKTSLIRRYVDGKYRTTRPTIGAAFFSKEVEVGENQMTIRIWDTSGQEQFRSLAPLYYRLSKAAILVYDISRQSSFDNLNYWANELRENLGENIIIFIAANKFDLDSEARNIIPFDSVFEYAAKINAKVFKTSAKTGLGIDDLFSQLCSDIAQRYDLFNNVKVVSKRRKTHKVNNQNLAKKKKKDKCC
eukprot:Anaeramoba_ignava/a223447_21.p1 GENE.a223447_21~~a223447_21.p1  ORF type:complete len:217 (-),score=49.42 a223447_21:80-730(-)